MLACVDDDDMIQVQAFHRGPYRRGQCRSDSPLDLEADSSTVDVDEEI
jgi:hypothetical protein